jgi:hypothetical protein
MTRLLGLVRDSIITPSQIGFADYHDFGWRRQIYLQVL